MARKIQVRRGTAANMPVLADGELGLQTDTVKLFIGCSGTNVEVAMGAGLINAIAGCAPSGHTHTAAQVGLGNVDNISADQIRRGGGKHLAGQGAANGYSFLGDGAEDTGMFSDSDGDLYFMTNAQKHPLSNFVEANGGVIAGINNEINSLKTSVANGKAQIASAISDKGISTGASADFGTMVNNIRAIKTGVDAMINVLSRMAYAGYDINYGSSGCSRITVSGNALVYWQASGQVVIGIKTNGYFREAYNNTNGRCTMLCEGDYYHVRDNTDKDLEDYYSRQSIAGFVLP